MKDNNHFSRCILTVLVLLFGFNNLKAQQMTFYKEYNDNVPFSSLFPMGLIQTSDGGYLVFSDYSLGPGQRSALLIKTNVTGDTIWTKFITDSSSAHATIITSALELPNGQGYMLSGYFIDPMQLNITSNALIFRLDVAGNMLWMKEMYDTPGYICWLKSSCIAYDGNILMSGEGELSNHTVNAIILKISLAGSVIWNKRISGDIERDANPQSIIELADHSILVMTDLITTVDRYARIIKLDSSGSLLWSKSYGTQSIHCIPYSFSAGPGNTLMLSGERRMVANNVNIGFMMSLDSTGTLSWYKEYGNWATGTSGIWKSFYVNNDIAAFNTAGNNVQLFMANNSGVVQWVKVFQSGSGIYANDLISTNDGGYALVSYDGASGVMIKTDGAGNIPCNSASGTMATNSGLISTFSFTPTVTNISYPEKIPSVIFGTGINVTSVCSSTGIGQVVSTDETFSIGPVPFSDQLDVTINSKSELVLKLCNVTGQEIISRSFTHQLRLNTDKLAAGVYIYTIYDKGVNIKKGKVLKY